MKVFNFQSTYCVIQDKVYYLDKRICLRKIVSCRLAIVTMLLIVIYKIHLWYTIIFVVQSFERFLSIVTILSCVNIEHTPILEKQFHKKRSICLANFFKIPSVTNYSSIDSTVKAHR